MRVVVIGARGQLGAAVVQAFASGHEVIPLARRDLDVVDDAAVAAAMERVGPSAIVNCAAYNDVDAAEDHPAEALHVNAFAVRALAAAAAKLDATLVHYSSDFVFDGAATVPYTEDDRPNPRSVYAASKLLGEWFAADAPRHYVLRVESLFGHAEGGAAAKGTVAGFLNKLAARETIRVFADRVVSPTYVPDAAKATRLLVERLARPGVYHCVNSGSCTWPEFATELAARLHIEPRLMPVRMADAALRAARPLYCALSNQKLRATGIEMPTWQDAVGQFAALIRSQSPAR
jgi:dTDP-4-dehydrorhamnose reductase